LLLDIGLGCFIVGAQVIVYRPPSGIRRKKTGKKIRSHHDAGKIEDDVLLDSKRRYAGMRSVIGSLGWDPVGDKPPSCTMLDGRWWTCI
jgi:hypothetical protein